MPKTLPEGLADAMDSGIFDPYLRVRLAVDDPETYTSVDVLSFKIADQTAECVIPYKSAYLANAYFALERGVIIAGEPVTIRTVYYSIVSMLAGPLGIELKGNVLPPAFTSFDGCIWYIDVIDRVFGSLGWALDMNVTYENPEAAWLSYLFYPAGRNLVLSNLQRIFDILSQKYLIHVADNCDGLFVFQATTTRAKDYDITDELLTHETITTPKRLMWRDEGMTVHYSGSTTNPLHNLGYIDSIQGSAPPNVASPRPFKSSKLPVHLKYRTGDVAKLGTATNYYQGRIKVTEIFDPKSNPSWHVIIEPLCWFNNTEGGAIPGTIEQAAPYTPLHTGYFGKVLSSGDNNLQAAMETLDDHNHDSDYAPIAKGVTNGDSHDHSGGDGAQINHTGLSNIGTNTHAQLDTFVASKAAANGLASLDANSAVPESQLAHACDWPGFTAPANDEHFFSLPAWSGWINDPTGTNGSKLVSAHVGNFQMDDSLGTPASIYYRNISTYASKAAYLFLTVGLNAEGGMHIDDGTLNNYMWFGMVYTASGFCKLVKRVVTGGGAPVSTDLVTGLPAGIYGLRFIYVNPAQFYVFKDLGLVTQLLSTQANYFNPARIGFYFLKTTTGSARRVGITRWADEFS